MAQTAEVFISYSREDKDRVLPLTQMLREAGVSLWIDQGGLDGAVRWSEEIVHALDGAKVLMLMVSQKSVTSHNVVKEVTLASERKGHILPVHIEPTQIPAELRYPLAGIQHIEYFSAGPEEGTKSIIRSLERLGVVLQKPDPKVVAPPPSSASHSMDSGPMVSIPDTGMAVLPFENSSADPDADYFSDGLTDELIASLSKVSELDLVSRLTSVQYKNTKKDARAIGQELQARYIVTGTVRKFQDNLRIAAQMVDAKTNKQLWAETYKGKLDDIFDIQEQVGQQIAEALKLKLTITERVALTKRPTVNAQAYDLFLRGREYLYQLTKRSLEYAIQLFEKAIELDPRYAAAYAACSSAVGLLYSNFKRDDRLKDKAQELGLKALMYDNNSAEAYAALAFSYYFRHEYEDAMRAGQRAMDLDPDGFLAYWIVGRVYYTTDKYEDARKLFLRAVEMEPTFYPTYNDLKLAYNALAQPENAHRMTERLLEILPTHILKYPDDSRARIFYANNLAEVGRVEEARQESKHVLEISSDDPLMLYNVAYVFANLREPHLAVECLKNAIAAGHEHFDWIKRDSDLDPIRNDPEYIELMKDK